MKTKDAAAIVLAAPERCPVCASSEVGAIELGWFAIELDRRDELADPDVEFVCRDCGSHWG
jgi:hypothetical protein